MHAELLKAAADHPERAEYDRALAAGMSPGRAGRLLSTQKPLTLRSGRSTWRVQNNPATLEAHADAAAKCPGFNGKKTPRATRRNYGETYRHQALGFKLWVPTSLQRFDTSELILGMCKLKLHHKTKTITGDVPDSWLVDLNAGEIVAESNDEELFPGWDLV
jgi:hypothetical protein